MRYLRLTRTALGGGGGTASYHDGIGLDFTKGIYYRKPTGGVVSQGSLTSLFTFTGGNQSMYMGAAGTLVASATNTPRIEYQSTTVGTNLLAQSQTFDNASWTKTASSITADATTAPDRTLTADKIVEDSTTAVHLAGQTGTSASGQIFAFSCYMKAAERTFAQLTFDTGTANGVAAVFNLSTGAISKAAFSVGTGGSATASITSVGDGWYRCMVSGSTGSTAWRALISPSSVASPGTTYPNYAGDGTSGIYIWGAQLEAGTSASTYTATTSTTPAYTNSSPAPLGLLMEAARTNLCLQSQDQATTWATNNVTISTNAVAAPDGTTTADRLVETAATGQHNTAQGITKAASSLTYTFSTFVKVSDRTYVALRLGSDTGGTNSFYCVFDLAAGTVGSNATTGAGYTFSTAGIQSYPNGWYRVWIVGSTNTGTTVAPMIHCKSDSSTSLSYTGTTSNGIYIWGTQVELGAFPSSYIPTTTVSVARTGDSCIRTLGTEFSATAGTVVVAGRASGGQDASATQAIYAFDDGTIANSIRYTRVAASDTSRFGVFVASAAQAALDATFVNSTNYKSASAWAANDFASSFNGAAVLTDAAGSLPTVTSLNLGLSAAASQNNGHIRTFDYYNIRLPNSFLQQSST